MNREARLNVLITGASSGIGRELVIDGLKRGYRISACARRRDRLEALRREIGDADGRLDLVVADVNDAEAMAQWVANNAENYGINALINNAGYGHNGPITKLALDDFRQQFETNFFAVVRLTQMVIPHMQNRGGDIIMISSILSHISLPGRSPYCSSKWALDGFAHAIRPELRRDGIRVAIINPGFTDTEFAQSMTIVGARPPTAKTGAMSAAKVARVTLNCIGRTRRNVLFTNLGRMAVFLQRRAPWLLERVTERSYRQMIEPAGR